jgi:hypothetical protein
MPRKKKHTETSLTPEEQALQERYAHLAIVPASLKGPGEVEGYGTKRTVEIRCACGAVRRVCTSDLFQIKGCTPCTVAQRREARRQKAKDTGESREGRGAASAASASSTNTVSTLSKEA